MIHLPDLLLEQPPAEEDVYFESSIRPPTLISQDLCTKFTLIFCIKFCLSPFISCPPSLYPPLYTLHVLTDQSLTHTDSVHPSLPPSALEATTISPTSPTSSQIPSGAWTTVHPKKKNHHQGLTMKDSSTKKKRHHHH